MKRLLGRIWELLPDGWDLLLIVGLAAFGVGVKYVAGVGAVWMFAGLALVGMAIMGAKRWDT